MSTPEQQLEDLVSGMDPANATLALVKYMFIRVAEMGADVAITTQVLGGIAGKVGLSKEDIKRLAARAQT